MSEIGDTIPVSEGGSQVWAGPVANHPRRAQRAIVGPVPFAQVRRSASIRSGLPPLPRPSFGVGPSGAPSAPPAGPTGYLSEVFASVEGEGLFLGRPAVFVRLAGCNLRCAYCDTKYAWENPKMALVYEGAVAREVPNPLSAADLVALVADSFGDALTVVFTGGEPLLQAGFLTIVMRDLRGLGYRIHLETNGTLTSALLALKDAVDFVSMDIKLPSTQGGKDLSAEHLDFLKAVAGKRVAVKIIVTPDAHDREIEDAVRLVAAVNRFIPMLLQPAFVDARPSVGADRLAAALATARGRVHDARLSIQMHKVIGAR